MENLQIGQKVKVLFYGICQHWVNGIYIGKIQEKTAIQNEVHGIKVSTGIALVLPEEFKERLQII